MHVDGILRTTTIPSGASSEVTRAAVAAATTILESLGYVGVLGVEFFVDGDSLLVNEIAPRVHNSGHWTQDGCVVDQFEQHIRAVTGWPLGNGSRYADVVMENLIGTEIDQLLELGENASVALHAYGKAATKPGRKMGHINRVQEH